MYAVACNDCVSSGIVQLKKMLGDFVTHGPV